MTIANEKQSGRGARPRLGPAAVLWTAMALAAVAVILVNAGELNAIARAVKSARPQYVAAAMAVQLAFMLNLARFYVTTFRAGGLRASTSRFLILTSASYFVNLVSNTTGLGGIAVYLDEAKRRSDPATLVTAAYMVAYALGYLAFFLVLALALGLLYARGSLTTAEVVASAVVVTVALAIALVLAAGLRSQAALEGVFLFAAKRVNFVTRALLKRDAVSLESVTESAGGLYEAVTAMKRRPARFGLPFAHAFGVEVLSALLLYCVALSLHAEIGFELALVGYALSLLFSLVSITPAGIGWVEASLSVLLISFGVPRPNAIAVSLGFRVFDFWLPVVIGALSLLVLRRSEARA